MQKYENKIEKHAQTVLTAIVAGLIAWVGFSVTDQGKILAVLTERVTTLQFQVEQLSKKPSLSADDFAVMIEPLKGKVLMNTDDVYELKKRVTQIEKDVYVQYTNPRKKIE